MTGERAGCLPSLTVTHEQWVAMTIEQRREKILAALNNAFHERGVLPPGLHFEFESAP